MDVFTFLSIFSGLFPFLLGLAWIGGWRGGLLQFLEVVSRETLLHQLVLEGEVRIHVCFGGRSIYTVETSIEWIHIL